MTRHARSILFFLFILSGFCGLLYQVVWLRLAFAAFGIVTPVLSVVISVFMVGLALGSWGGGHLARRLASSKISPLWLYGIVEAGVGVGAFVLPLLFHRGESYLLSFGEMDSGRYLLTSGALIAAAVLPWCLCMGATFPAAMAYLKRLKPSEETSFSFLYLANVVGAMAGALVTAVALVELLGFTTTLWVAAALNVVAAITSFVLASQDKSKPLPLPAKLKRASARLSQEDLTVLSVLFLTGFASMAMEVVWTRAFTPALKTTIYAFAALLATYLLATWRGSLKYRRDLAKGTVRSREELLARLALAACLPIALNDPRLHLQAVGALFGIYPFCALLGYLTPMLIDRYSHADPRKAGSAYAVNIAGCVLGPLVAGYWLLPALGVKWSLIALAAPFFLCFVPFARKAPPRRGRVLALTSVGTLALCCLLARTYEEQALRRNDVVRRDHTATVISSGVGRSKRLIVNGIGITIMHSVTKNMAHFPLALHKQPPKKALVICFGMGTTFRSLLSWDIDTWAVELVPSVRDAFGYYFEDAAELVKRPNAHIVVDDGRRFLRRTPEIFDVITLDPPPPIEAAGSSLLYSTEFYEDVKARLAPEGILQQWFPGGDSKILHGISRSLVLAFPHVRVFRGHEGMGYHFIASRHDLGELDAKKLYSRLPATARRDMEEWTPKVPAEQMFKNFVGAEIPIEAVLGAPDWFITDDRPLNEYYLLRRLFARN